MKVFHVKFQIIVFVIEFAEDILKVLTSLWGPGYQVIMKSELYPFKSYATMEERRMLNVCFLLPFHSNDRNVLYKSYTMMHSLFQRFLLLFQKLNRKVECISHKF